MKKLRLVNGKKGMSCTAVNREIERYFREEYSWSIDATFIIYTATRKGFNYGLLMNDSDVTLSPRYLKRIHQAIMSKRFILGTDKQSFTAGYMIIMLKGDYNKEADYIKLPNGAIFDTYEMYWWKNIDEYNAYLNGEYDN